jgi:hypothetical protein
MSALGSTAPSPALLADAVAQRWLRHLAYKTPTDQPNMYRKQPATCVRTLQQGMVKSAGKYPLRDNVFYNR